MIARGFGTAAVLLMLVLILFITARLLARPRGARPPPVRRLRAVRRPSPRRVLRDRPSACTACS